uniref:Uncharacterized protein n=1 Tax=Aegilops tauschii TaxID=37682 RepID=M8BPB6_AEGTA
MVTPLVNPTASTTTHASSAPVPDVSCSTTTPQEVLEVILDASPAYTATTPTTCSTDGLNQVVPTAIVNEVRDAATTVCLDPTVDLDNEEGAM